MIYGIDLGTTNSLIGFRDTLFYKMQPSLVNRETMEAVDVDEDGVESSFKVDMSTSETGKVSIDCSAVILKHLVNKANEQLNQNVKDVIVSVPAKFSHAQRTATKISAEQAGLVFRGLINEPTAAAIYACKNFRELVVVYDLGGGTFDVSIVDTVKDFYDVVSTDGQVLAGDNLDDAILNYFIEKHKVPIIRRRGGRRQGKLVCKEAKEKIQKIRSSVPIEIPSMGISDTLTVKEYKRIMIEVFEITFRLTQNLIDISLGKNDKPKVLFVGGSTNDPYLKEELLSRLGLEELVVDEKPDFLVAKGVAYYADLFESGKVKDTIKDVVSRISLGLSDGTTQTIVPANKQLPVEGKLFVTNDKEANELNLMLYQGNDIIRKQNNEIGNMRFKYNKTYNAGEGNVYVQVKVDRDGLITLTGEDTLTSDIQDIIIEKVETKASNSKRASLLDALK